MSKTKTEYCPGPVLGDQVSATVDEWAKQAVQMRDKKLVKLLPSIYETFRPSLNWIDSFDKARYQVVQDIGIVGNKLIATLANGWLTISFFEDVRIEPHCRGRILNYHMFNGIQTLDHLHSYIPTNDGITHCLLVFGCNNNVYTFEYLITPQAGNSLAFEMTFTPLGEQHA